MSEQNTSEQAEKVIIVQRKTRLFNGTLQDYYLLCPYTDWEGSLLGIFPASPELRKYVSIWGPANLFAWFPLHLVREVGRLRELALLLG